ncbi:MAG: PD40 domain-containing protein [Planctomycetia bacterium]|nr:PD40 domain-containing protein [Planctomycetia bacterium]
MSSQVRRLAAMLSLSAALALTAFAGDDDRLKDLVRQLDDDDPAARDAASAALEEAGDAAVALLKETAASGPPEARGRAVAILARLRVKAIVGRPENAELRSRWAAISGGDAAARREAIKAWGAAARGPKLVDSALELLDADPTGAAGDAACELLSWLLAPRRTARVESTSCSMASSEPYPARRQLDLFFKGNYEATEEAAARLDACLLPPRASDKSHSTLDELRFVCTSAAVVWRMSDESPKVRIEMPEESLMWWREWWAGARGDRFALMDLGFEKAPDGSALGAKDVPGWLESLASADGRRARVARRVLRDLPSALIAEVKGDAPAVAAFRERLLLRDRGRLLFGSDRDGTRALWSMKLDGSDVRKASGELREVWSGMPVPGGQAAVACGTAPDGSTGLYLLDLTGTAAPKKLADGGGSARPAPDGKRVAVRHNDGSLLLLDIATGASGKIADGATSSLSWSPDGRRLAWSTGGAFQAWTADGGVRTFKVDTVFHNLFAWSPDGGAIAFPGKGRIHVLDLATGDVTPAGDAHTSVYKPAWSPDGSRIAFARCGKGEKIATIEIFDVGKGTSTAVPDPGGYSFGLQGHCRFSPDGRLLAYSSNSRGDHCLLIEGGKTREITATWFADWILDGWMLDFAENDLLLRKDDGSLTINLTESAADEYNVVFVGR